MLPSGPGGQAPTLNVLATPCCVPADQVLAAAGCAEAPQGWFWLPGVAVTIWVAI
jgi:hypothetical protein